MAIEGISISLEQVLETARNIKSLNTQIVTRLNEIKREMNSLESSWQSESSTTIRANFNKLEAKFENYKNIIDSYRTFLENTVEAYSTTESSINNNASAFE